MKGSCALIASVLAASAVALSSSFSSCGDNKLGISHPSAAAGGRAKIWSGQMASGGDKFAPRFDGLRFIETLITAHR